jgi:hypothetical protein
MNRTVGGLVESALAQSAFQREITLELEEGVRLNYESLQNVSSLTLQNADNIEQFANQTNDQFNDIAKLLARVSANISDAFLEKDSILLRNQILAREQVREAERYINNLKTILKRWYLDEDTRNGLSIQIHEALGNPLVYTGSTGAFLTPFLPEIGVRPGDPNSLNPSEALVLVSDDFFKYVTVDNQFGVVTRLQFICEAEFMATRAPMNPSRSDVSELLGPIGCDTTMESDVLLKCKCLIRVSETRCRVIGPLSGSSQTEFYLDTTQLVEGRGCVSPAVSFSNSTGGMDGLVLSDVSGLADALERISRRGVSSGTNYNALSLIPGIRNSVPWSQSVSNSDNFMRLLLAESGSSPLNLVYVYVRNVQSSYAVTYNNLGYAQSLVYGRPPKGMNQKQTLYRRFKQGQSGRCTAVSAMLFSDEVLLVSVLVPSQIITNVEVTIDGEQTLVSDVAFTSPMNDLLPKKAMVWSPGNFGSKLWDIPEREISLRPQPQGREKTVTYAACNKKEECDYTAWTEANGNGTVEFDHDAAKNLPPPYEAQIDSNPASITFGRCITSPKAPGGKLCAMRNHFQVLINGNFESDDTPGTMIFVDRDPIYTARISVPEGAITEVLSSACPVVQEIATSGTILLIELVNQLNSSNAIRIREVGGCNKVQPLTLGASASTVYKASSCPLSATLRIDYLSGSTYVPCPIQIELSFTPETLAGFQGPASLNLTYSMQIQKRDEIILAIERQRIELSTAIMTMANLQLQRERSLGFQMPSSTLLLYDTLYARSQQVAEDAARRVALISNSDLSTDEIIEKMEEERRLAAIRFEEDLARIKEAKAAFDEQNKVNANQIVFVRVANDLAEKGFVDAIEKTSLFWAALLKSINESVQQDPRSGWSSYDLESSSGDGSASRQAWGKVGDFFTNTFGNSESGIGGLFSKLFGDPLALVRELFSAKGPFGAVGAVLLIVSFLIMIPLVGYGGYRLFKWLTRPRVYEGDQQAIIRMKEKIAALRLRLESMQEPEY